MNYFAICFFASALVLFAAMIRYLVLDAWPNLRRRKHDQKTLGAWAHKQTDGAKFQAAARNEWSHRERGTGNTDQAPAVDQQRLVRSWDDVKRDPTATPIEREIALMHEWNLALRELRRLEAEVAQTLNENAHLAEGDNCTLIRLKRAIGWANKKNGHQINLKP